ncbi:MAG: hypothetical protein V7641_2836 [Blastocatellia bacterium]
MKWQRDTATRRHGDAARERRGDRHPHGTRRRVAFAFCLLPFAFCLLSYAAQPPASPINRETGAWLLKQTRARFQGKALDEAGAPRAVTMARPTTLFITTFQRGLAARPLAGSGATLLAALKAALDSVSPNIRIASSTPDRIQIDMLDGEFASLEKSAESERDTPLSAAQLIQPGVEGIAIETQGRAFYLPPSQLINSHIFADDADEQTAADLLNRAANYFGVNDWRARDVRLRRFRTAAFVEDRQHRAALDLTGSGLLQEINRARLNRAARAGGDYLIRAQKSDGSFHYDYDPFTESVSERDYNILRHAGATIALFQLYEATHEARYTEAARRAMVYLKSRFRWAREAEALYVLDDDGKAKLGANGLALLALAMQMRLDPKSADRESALRLANLILRMQERDGSFASYYDMKGEPEDRASLYYPGEAMLGLLELYRLTGDPRLIEAARRGANYLIETQQRLPSLPPDAWLMQALEALFAIKREPSYAAHTMRIAEAMIKEQYSEADAPLYAGGYRPGVPRATPAASRAEGMLAAWRLARLTNDARAARLAEALKLSARFQLAQQVDADNSYYLASPERAVGGFRESLTSARIRIDYVQHNISALLGIAQILE